MRALILVAGAALAVSACTSKEAANNTVNVDENLGTEMNAPEMNAPEMNTTMDMNTMDTNATAPEANATTNNAM